MYNQTQDSLYGQYEPHRSFPIDRFLQSSFGWRQYAHIQHEFCIPTWSKFYHRWIVYQSSSSQYEVSQLGKVGCTREHYSLPSFSFVKFAFFRRSHSDSSASVRFPSCGSPMFCRCKPDSPTHHLILKFHASMQSQNSSILCNRVDPLPPIPCSHVHL